mmetsp:Transcript_26842/g.65234  ORF Transcript_26842/g.65234 Transcript_26842/m.65234 type:complete len:338 (+) Transcript_26842:108-1121(+)|eukprot:CAMPEP_0113627850 /NCGR_PEP_ID=MMETSP0017_2-20120614/14427_1 /TAXON_ID=2856 /ORGANISM="Cylindrotheca closterium" /LENGTH=337 /DNA_ID=CAMNT_0000538127 /DNA_START=24 /DNA_END=1037 /DNA_ORIENTATION=+ /assembly_acc=CAM_ASM_000147
MSRWAKQVTRVGRDGFQLARAIFKDSTTKRAVSFKPVLLDQARRSNLVANSLLQVDRQIGLVRYYGFMGYFQQQFQARFSSSLPPSTTSEDSSSATTETTADSTSPPNKARIAFMITGSMKQELSEQLGYDLDEDIKKMTPLQASLILHYRIPVDEMEEKLPLVEERYEKKLEEDALKQQQQAEEMGKQRAAQMEMKKAEAARQEAQGEASAAVEASADAANVQQETPAAQAPSSAPSPLTIASFSAAADEFQSSNMLLSSSSDNNNNFNGFGDSWFEVIETNPATGESSRVGLYQEEEEAILGLKTRQEIAERRETDLTFELKPIEKSNIFSKQQV